MKKIAIIGGSYLQLPAVLKAKELGYEVHCFAWRDGAVCENYADYFYPISIKEKEEILKECQRIGIDGIVTIASDLAVLTVNYLASRMGLIANPEEYSGITTNKYLMRNSLSLHDIPSPRYALVNKTLKYDLSGFEYPLIIKPTDRSGSRGVEKISHPFQVEDAISRAQEESFGGEVIIEEYITGREVSVEGISYEGRHYILQITDKVTTGAPYFVELAHHQPSTLPMELKEQIKRIVMQSLDALHICYGASHSELKITQDGDIRVIEIGARMGGDFIGSDLVQLSTGYDYLGATIKIAMGEFTVPVVSMQKCSGVYFLCKETGYLKSIIEHKSDYQEIVRAEITDTVLRNVECSGDRSGYLIYQGNTRLNLLH